MTSKELLDDFKRSQIKKSGLFGSVDFSKETYSKDLSLLKKLQKSLSDNISKKNEVKEVVLYKELISSFEDFIKDYRTGFTESEEEHLNGIIKGKYPLLIKRRMFEDFSYKIKKRIEIKEELLKKKIQIEKEITDIEVQKSTFLTWINVTIFAYRYETITLFSHKVKAKNLEYIKVKAFEWQSILSHHLQGVLDEQAEDFTTQEYNILELVLQFSEPLKKIESFDEKEFDANVLSGVMDDFAVLFFKFCANKELGDVAIRKAIKLFKLPRNLASVFSDFQEDPRFRLKTKYTLITNSILGSLISYYTSLYRKVIQTFSQMVYLSSANLEISNNFKNLTPKAKELELKKIRVHEKEEARIVRQYETLKMITEKFLVMGEEIINRLYQKESSGVLGQDEFEKKKHYYIKTMLDYFFLFFGYPMIGNEKNIVFMYKTNIYKDVFVNNIELQKKLKKLFEIYKIFSTFDWKVKHVNESQKDDSFVKISRYLYSTARCIVEIISSYHHQKDVFDGVSSVGFFETATAEKSIAKELETLLEKEEILFYEYLEAAASMAYYIAYMLGDDSFKELNKEKERLEEIYFKIILNKKKPSEEQGDVVDFVKIENDNQLLRKQIAELQKDQLTGLFNRHYLNDVVVPMFYDDNKNVPDEIVRYIFFCDIDKFKNFNDHYGHDIGDEVLKKVAKIIQKNVCLATLDKQNVVIRLGGEEIFGYINNLSREKILKLFDKIINQIANIDIYYQGKKVQKISLSIGIYQEFKNSNHSQNLHIVDKLMYYVKEHGRSNIAFLKDHKKKLTSEDFDDLGEIKKDLIELYY